MKTRLALTSLIVVLTASQFIAQTSVDSTGWPGDHFSLEAALEAFKNSKSPEDFEKKINTENSYVNNLDLNEDGEVDFVKVIDYKENNLHALVLQVDINENEKQDIAVIEIEKTGDETAILQILGDEDIYGPDMIIEPFDLETESDEKGPDAGRLRYTRIIVNVWAWPSVRFIYGPTYRLYVSPYYWGHYPGYWKAWHARPWRWHYSARRHLTVHYRISPVHRVTRAHAVYTPKRESSTVIRSRTVVRNGNNRTVVRKTTKVNNSKSAVKGKKKVSKTRVSRKKRE